MPNPSRPYWRAPAKMIARAREPRQNMTPAERELWKHVRNRQLAGIHFCRQDPVECFVIDFVCARAKLAVEIDGDTHATQEEYDAERTRWLNEHKGYRVIRFSNQDVLHNIEGVMVVIRQALHLVEDEGPPDAP